MPRKFLAIKMHSYNIFTLQLVTSDVCTVISIPTIVALYIYITKETRQFVKYFCGQKNKNIFIN